VTEDILDWDSRPVRVARSRGGVMALCDVRRAVLHDPTGEWPPAQLKPKLKRSSQIKAFDPPRFAELQENLGFYCDLQSIQLDANGGEAAPTYPVGRTPVAIAVGPHAAWVANFQDSTLTRIAYH
jgi:hypothetical protein